MGVALPPPALHHQSDCCILYKEEEQKKETEADQINASVKARLKREKSELLTNKICSFSLLLFLHTEHL